MRCVRGERGRGGMTHGMVEGLVNIILSQSMSEEEN